MQMPGGSQAEADPRLTMGHRGRSGSSGGGSFNNAAVGTVLGQTNGVQAQDRSRQVIALCGDGRFNVLMGEFLTAITSCP
jgi:thiamine pyrophosphate-dependent acetolactate synthase large subunit-like protein